MSIESPIFDNVYVAVGVMGLLVLLLVVLLVYWRRRRSGRPPAEAREAVESAPDDQNVHAGAPSSPAPPDAPEPPAGAAPPQAAPSAPAVPPGDPVAAVVTSLVDSSGDLTDTELRRLELFRPARVMVVVDSLATGLSGRGKEIKQLRLMRIRQYAESLQAQGAATAPTPEAPPKTGPPLPPPGSGTSVAPPETWGTRDTATPPLPLDEELSFHGGSVESLIPLVLDPSVQRHSAVPSAGADETEAGVADGTGNGISAEEAASPGEAASAEDFATAEDVVSEGSDVTDTSAEGHILGEPVAEEIPEDYVRPNGGPPPTTDSGLWSDSGSNTAPEAPVFAESDHSQRKEPLVPPTAPTEPETPVPTPPPYTPEEASEPPTIKQAEPPAGAESTSATEESLEKPSAISVETSDASDRKLVRDGWDNPVVVERDTPQDLTSLSPEKLGHILQGSGDKATKLAVLGALETIGTPSALAAVEGCLEDTDPEVLLRALDVAERLLAELGESPA